MGKLKNDKIKLKRHLQVTRHNNGVLQSMIEELKTKNKEIQKHLQESKAIIANKTSKIDFCNETIEKIMKKEEKSKTQIETLENEIDDEMTKNLRCQTDIDSKQELILELKSNQSQLMIDLEICKTSNVDLVITQRELKECKNENEAEMETNIACLSAKRRCDEELKNEIQKNTNLESENSRVSKSLEEAESLAFVNLKVIDECNQTLEYEVKENKVLSEKFESICPVWSEWTDCSKTCWGIKRRFDKCSIDDFQINSCNQESSCLRAGEQRNLRFEVQYCFSDGG